MSEPLDGIEWNPPRVPIRDAAAVILLRGDGAREREVFWVRRGERLAFSGGFHAFPGGKVDAADAAVPIAGCPPGEAPFRVAAIRELFEETGVLLAGGAPAAGRERLAALRRQLIEGHDFAALLAGAGLVLDAGPLVPAGRWVTPEFSPVRFDARFYLVRLPPGAATEILPGELLDGGWIRPADALSRWEEGRVLLHPPATHALATLAGCPFEAAVPRLRRVPFLGPDHVSERIEFQRGVLLAALRAPTLPPAEHTNCWVLGTGDLVAVDPGSPHAGEIDRLERLLRELEQEGRKLRGVIVTHAHRDHTGGAEEIARRFGVPLRASAAAAPGLAGAEGTLADGDEITLDGPLPMRWRVLLTEGHARGHLCLYEERSGALVAGDMVAGGSTIVIDPPEGDMGVYLDSLRRLAALAPRAIFPAHGLAVANGPGRLAEYLAHRERRLEDLAAALGPVPQALRALVEEVYADTPALLYPAADRSALASLLELEKRGRAARDGERWVAPRRRA